MLKPCKLRGTTGSFYRCDSWNCPKCRKVKVSKIRTSILDHCKVFRHVYVVNISPDPKKFNYSMEMAKKYGSWESYMFAMIWEEIKAFRVFFDKEILTMWAFIERGSEGGLFHYHAIVVFNKEMDLRFLSSDRHTMLEKEISKRLGCMVVTSKVHTNSVHYVTKYISKAVSTNERLKYFRYTKRGVAKYRNQRIKHYPFVRLENEVSL